MTDDIVAQLTELACISGHSELAEAADEITHLRAEINILRAAAAPLVAALDNIEQHMDIDDSWACQSTITMGELRALRAALKGDASE